MSHPSVIERVGEAIGLLAEACAELDVDRVAVSEVTTLHGLLVRGERIAAGARVRLARRVLDVREVSDGVGGTVGWIARQTGSSVTEARAALAVSAELPVSPHLDAALEVGAVTTTQAVTIRGGVVADPSAEAELVGMAALPGADLRALRRRTREVVAAADPDPDATRARHHRRRSLRTWHDEDGEWHAHLSAPADTGAVIAAAIAQASDEAFRAAHAEGRREPSEAYALDGFVATLTRPTGTGTGTGTTRTRQGKVIGIVDVAAITRGSLEPGDRCELAGVGPVSLSAMRDLLGEASVAVLVRRGTVDLAVAHLGRQPTAFQQTAVEARGGVCAVEDCGATRNLEIDHTRDWAVTRRTVTADLDLLCQPDHDAKTRGLIRLTGPPGRRRAVPVGPGRPRPP